MGTRTATALAALACLPGPALAGMPSAQVVLRKAAEAPLSALSFFLFGFLASALAVMLLWNYVARDWPALPRLTYLKALGLVGLWSLLFVLVLTMISGARELMTPGAWRADGAVYLLDEK